MSAREFVVLVKESSLGTVMTSPVNGTDKIAIRLTEGNSFGMEAELVMEQIPYGGGLAITGQSVSDHYACKGQLKTKLYPSQAPLLMALLATRINSGQTLPWVTTEPQGDLASVSVYHAVKRSDGTYKRRRFAGVKAAGGTVEVSRDGTTASLTLDLMGSRSYGNGMDGTADPDATEFPEPAGTDYPSGPYTFRQTGGLFIARSSGSATRNKYDSISIQITNKLAGRWFEAAYLLVNQFCGRESKADINLYFQGTPDDRAAYETIAPQVVSFGFDNGVTGQKMTVQFNANSVITGLPYDLPIDNVYMQKMTLLNQFDGAANEDLSISFS